MIVAWFDPGLLTGACVADIKTGQIILLNEFNLQRTGELLESIRAYEQVSVGWETYTILKGAQSQAPWSLEVIGMLKYLCGKYAYDVLQPADPGQRLICTPVMLKEMGWYPRVKNKKDALSSAQHCVAWWLRTDTLPKQYHDSIYGPLHN